ncbi:MAG: metal-dependent hydrolase [Acidobacteria bacterium]|nr:metal-dependent hydrolase [Acidobacteriota bacterium]MBI3278412.1 metal-dependent hydrolase [Acidobacteriota bacterium]
MIGITWLGHSTFQLELESGEVLVLDPWTEGNPSFPKGHQFSRVDALLVSHGHFDHIHDAVPLAKRFDAQAVGIYEICQWLEKKGVSKTRPMNKGGSQQVGLVTVTMTHAVHSCGILEEDGSIIYGGEACGYVITLPDTRRVYFAGDTNVFSDMALVHQLYEPQLAFLPIGDLFTMSPREAALACELLRPELVIPMHFGTFPPLTGRPEQLQELLVNSKTKVWPLEPGKRVEW